LFLRTLEETASKSTNCLPPLLLASESPPSEAATTLELLLTRFALLSAEPLVYAMFQLSPTVETSALTGNALRTMDQLKLPATRFRSALPTQTNGTP
jgi:hypothetical protein